MQKALPIRRLEWLVKLFFSLTSLKLSIKTNAARKTKTGARLNNIFINTIKENSFVLQVTHNTKN